MLIFFCPNCWSQVKEDEKICPKCYSEIEALGQRSYIDRLVSALRHPWASTRMEAAYILGEIGDKQAVKPLGDVIDQIGETQDLFFLREIAIALGKINGDEAVPALVHLLDHRSFLIRKTALQSLPRGKNKLVMVAVKKALSDPSSTVRELAREFLEKNSE
jgi:HEAT repeat protein